MTETQTVTTIDESADEDNDEAIATEQALTDTQEGFKEDFVIKVGTTIIEDKLSGTQAAGYRAECTDKRTDETYMSVGEHPADAVLTCIEEATDGLY